MTESISVTFEMTGDVTGQFHSIASSARGCCKQLEELRRQIQQLDQRYTNLNKKAAETAAKAQEIKNQMGEVREAFRLTGDAAEELELKKLTERYEKLTNAAKDYAEAAKGISQEMSDAQVSVQKLEGNSGFLEGKKGLNQFLSSGVFKDLGASAMGLVNAGLASSMGDLAGDILGEILSSTLSGAATGAAAGLPGAIAGAVLGGVSSIINGYTKNFQAEDNAFKDYYKSLYEAVSQNTEESLTRGKELAAMRESAQKAESGSQTKTTQELNDALQGLIDNIDAAGGASYNTLRSQGASADIFAYSGALGDALEQVNAAAGENRAYGENLRDQYEREALSRVMLSDKDLGDAIRDGKLDKELFSPEQIQKLGDLRTQYQAASDIYENDKDSDAGRQAGLDMERLYEAAQALATGFYESSEWYQNVQDTELEQIDAIRENTKGLEAFTNTLRIKNAFTIGQGISFGIIKELTVDTTDPNNLPGMTPGQSMGRPNRGAYGLNGSDGFDAFGLRRVPFDGYRAILHQDEQVLTAAEARERGSGGGMQVTFSGPITVRQDSDLDEIASRLADKIELARMRAG